MSKFKRSFFPVLLLLPFLTTGCLATKSVTVDMEFPPSNPINSEAGVAFYDLVGNTSDEKSLAKRLSGKMSESMSKGNQGFKPVSANDLEKIDQYRERSAKDWDNFSSEHSDALSDIFGQAVPPTGFFSGSVVITVNEQGPIQEELLPSLLELSLESDEQRVAREKKGKQYTWVNKGNCTLTVSIAFTDIGTGGVTSKSFEKETPEITQSGRSRVEVAKISHSKNLTKAMNEVLTDFERTWVISTQPVTIPLFVGDGFWQMPWEDSEYPYLVSGFKRMKSGQYDRAASDYAKQAEAAHDGGPEMDARIWYDQAAALEAEGLLEEAKVLYEKATDASPEEIFSKGLERCERSIENAEAIRELNAANAPATPEA